MLEFVEEKFAIGTFVILSIELPTAMLEVDFSRSREIDSGADIERPWRPRLAVKAARVASPLQ